MSAPSGQSLVTWLVLGMALALLSGCAQPGPPLYMWEDFARQQYAALQRDGTSPLEQLTQLEAHAAKARAAGAALPPGFRAHLGMVKLSLGDADTARQLWQAEVQAFPESAPFIERLLKRLEAPRGAPQKSVNPA